MTYDKGTEFMGDFAQMIQDDYGIKKRPITKRNPQANAIIERIHQTIGNMIRTFEITEQEVDESDPWSGLLSAVMFATRATYYSTLKATPMQLVFGHDAILNTTFEANWKNIKDNKQKCIHQNNVQENKSRIAHTYHLRGKVLFKEIETNKYGNNPYSGPYVVRKVNNNGTVMIKKGKILETVNIRLIKPFRE